MKGIMRWVRLHPYNISQKVQVVVEHFRENVQPLLNGHAKAMVVVGQPAGGGALAVRDRQVHQGSRATASRRWSRSPVRSTMRSLALTPFTETSKTLNPNLRGRDIREAFDTDEYQILLVANKFQTGFDQPLLCGMYVDKRLAGIQAVQTLSRLNRSYADTFGKKDTTYRPGFRERSRRGVGSVQGLLPDGGTGECHRPEPRLQLADQAGCRRTLRRF